MVSLLAQYDLLSSVLSPSHIFSDIQSNITIVDNVNVIVTLAMLTITPLLFIVSSTFIFKKSPPSSSQPKPYSILWSVIIPAVTRILSYIMVVLIIFSGFYALYTWSYTFLPFLRLSGYAYSLHIMYVMYATMSLLYLFLKCVLTQHKQYNFNDTENSSTSSITNQTTSISLDPPRWCKHCQQRKSYRTHHCSPCGRCIPRMDHHCIFLANCIGASTYLYFYALLVHLWLAVVYCYGITYIPFRICFLQDSFTNFLVGILDPSKLLPPVSEDDIWWCENIIKTKQLVFIVAVVAVLCSSALLAFWTYLLYRNLTMLEYLGYIFGIIKINEYNKDQSTRINWTFKTLFNWLGWILLPFFRHPNI